MFKSERFIFVFHRMNQLRKFSSKTFFIRSLVVVFLFTVTSDLLAQRVPPGQIKDSLTKSQDSLKLKSQKTDSIAAHDSVNISVGDTLANKLRDSTIQVIDTFSLKLSKDTLDAPVHYAAEDSVVILIQDKKILLYGKTKTEYQTITLEAPKVEINQPTQILTAYNSRDTTGAVMEDAIFSDGDQTFTSDTIQYNFKTQRGLTKNTITTSGEGFVHGEVVKKVSKDVTFVKRGYFTTCNLDDPHFGFRASKIKVVNKKVAISGATHPEFEGVPIPVYLPFGYFPLNQGRHSGMIAPTFATNDQMGIGLEGGGYYKVINDYWDAKIYGSVYSYGSWNANFNPTYRKRYHYAGSLNFGLQHTKRNFKGDPDYYANNSYILTWNHQSDMKARPGVTFGANVNASSTAYNKNVPNNVNLNFQNQLTSSITYSKTWIDKPFNLTMSANHSQNNQTGVVNLSVPSVGFTMTTINPLQGKNPTGKWYEQLGIGYNGSFRNQISFYDSAVGFQQLLDTLQWGAQHNIPITLSLPPILGGAVMVAPSVSYSQVWLAQKFLMNWNDGTKKVDTTIQKGIYIDQQASFGLQFSTALFGTFPMKKGKALRHVLRPTVGVAFAPSFSKKYYDYVSVDGSDTNKIKYSQLQGGLYGGYSDINTGGITFGLDNNLELKYWPKNDTTGEARKLRIIDGFGFAGSYNFLAPDRKLSHINFYFRNNLFEKINLNMGMDMSPYLRDRFGYDSVVYIWKGDQFKIGRITSGSISLSTSFQSKPKDPKKAEQRQKEMDQQFNDPVLAADRERLLEYMRRNPAEFVDFNIPWQINLSYALSFSEQPKSDYSGFEKVIYSTASFNGSFSLTPKWNFSVNGFYDFRTNEIQTFTMSIAREMHCWQLAINITPVGPYHYFSFNISPKSGLLQDLRINRTRSFYNGY